KSPRARCRGGYFCSPPGVLTHPEEVPVVAIWTGPPHFERRGLGQGEAYSVLRFPAAGRWAWALGSSSESLFTSPPRVSASDPRRAAALLVVAFARRRLLLAPCSACVSSQKPCVCQVNRL